MIRDDIKAAQIAAMKAGDKTSRAAITLIQSAIKNRDIEARTGKAPEDDDALVVEVLQKMVKQRRDSVSQYDAAGREDLSRIERDEMAIIEHYLPAKMGEAEVVDAIDAAIRETGAGTPADIGKLMAVLKPRLAGRADMGEVSRLVKQRLSGG